jgi:hypothetical protein
MFSGFMLVLSMILYVQPARAQYNQPTRDIRITTGCYKVGGWEKGLIRKNHSLSHFTWVPITSYTQGVLRPAARPGASTQAAPATAQPLPKFSYVKPIQAPTIVAKKPQGNPYVHLQTQAPMTNEKGNQAASDAGSLNTEADVAGAVQQPATRTYASGYGKLSSHPASFITKREVYGKLKQSHS